MRFDGTMKLSREWLAEFESDDESAEEESTVITPAICIDLSRHDLVLYEEQGQWGIARRGEDDTLYRVSDASYDAIYCIRDDWYAAKKGDEWYLLTGGHRYYDNSFPNLESLLDHLQQKHHRDAEEYAQAQKAIRPAEIVLRDPILDALIFRDEDGWGVGSDRNKYLASGEVIPVPNVRFDSDEFTIIPPFRPGCSSAVIGKNGDCWSIVCLSNVLGNFHYGDVDSLEEAYLAWRERPGCLRSEDEDEETEAMDNASPCDLGNWQQDGF